jgi:hypothetical protein
MFGIRVPEFEAAERFDLRNQLGQYASAYREPQQGVHVDYVDGDLRIDGDLALDWSDGWAGCAGLVVKGNLDVAGNLVNENSNNGPFLLVGGNLHAKNVVAGGAFIAIQGDALIDELLLGHYNDGNISIAGTTRAALILSDDHAMTVNTESPYWNGHAMPYGMPLSDYLHADVKVEIEDDYQHVEDVEELIRRIREGKPVVRDANDPRPRKSVEEWMRDIEADGRVIRFAPKELRTYENYLAAVRSNGYALELVPQEFLTDEMLDAALAQNATAIADFPKERITPERARVAVMKDGGNISYVPDALRTPELCMLAIEHETDTLLYPYIPDELFTEAMAERAIEKDPFNLIHIPERFRTPELREKAGFPEPGSVEISPEFERLMQNPSTMKLFWFSLKQARMIPQLVLLLVVLALLIWFLTPVLRVVR